LSWEENFQGKNFTLICLNSNAKFYLSVLLSLCQLNFTCGDVPENCPGEIIGGVGMVWKIFFTHPDFPGGGGFSMLEFSVAGIPLCKNLHAGLDFWHD